MDKEQLFQQLATCEDILNSIKESFAQDDEEKITLSLRELESRTAEIQEMLRKNQIPSNLLNAALDCCMNLKHSLDSASLVTEKRHRIFHYEILVSFAQLRHLLHWKYEILGSPLEQKKYHESLIERLESLHETSSGKDKYKYKASIFLTGYNNLEYTRLAVESIMKYTDLSEGNVELITINNGSTDGTEEFFETLSNEKKINLKYHLSAVPDSIFSIAEGQYIIQFSNRAVATPHWLEQLLLCMESSPDIAMAVPTCNADVISREQGIPVPYENQFDDMDSMQRLASEHNHSDPGLWEERSALTPFVAVYRSDLLSLQLTDPAYVKPFFSDDDLSTLFRRSGWRMILAKDTFLHYFGSDIPGMDKKENAETNADMSEMRKVYFNKWGIDAWESGGNLPSFQMTEQWIAPVPNGRILWIDPKFGADFLKIKNKFRKEGNVKADAIVLKETYAQDTKPYFDRCIQAKKISDAVTQLGETYDVIGMGGYFHEMVHENPLTSLEQLYSILNPGGIMLVPVKNFGSASSLTDFIHSGGMSQYEGAVLSFTALNVRRLLREVTQHKDLRNVRVQGLSFPQDTGLGNIMGYRLAELFAQSIAPNAMKDNLKLSMMWFCFFRP